MKLQVRMNIKKKAVEVKSSEHTKEPSALQKATDFIKAFMLGFELNDAIALLRLDDLYIESFEVKDGKNHRCDLFFTPSFPEQSSYFPGTLIAFVIELFFSIHSFFFFSNIF